MKSTLSRLTFAGVLAVSLVCGTPWAEARELDAATTAELKDKFAKADKNGDGKLTRAEADAGMPRIARAFDKIDAQKAGTITLPEILAFVAKN